MEWYLAVLRKYATFGGRAHRTEFWFFTLWSLVVSLVLLVIELALGLGNEYFGPLTSLYSVAVFVPSLAVGARRLHDIGRSGWWQLLMLIPILGAIVLIVWWARKGEPQRNAHGPDPWAGSDVSGATGAP